jgi:UDP-2-acetamido-3-amino-2,3-dideoxy-glucuronate N-acetyltransferase
MIKTKFKAFKKKSGKLIAFSLKKSFPIKVKRIFFINGKKGFTRGDHAHKKCSQFVFPILGKIKIDCVSKNEKKIVILDFKKNEGYLLKPKTWCKIKFMTKNAILLVACDMEYKFSDYIENYKEFLKIIKRN